ncbi:HepT-like ribonuclease domain-containing protein [Nitratifractor salsuginis]|uniref:HepT-like ribonuclease domain-containing protein n=1 Tax=Nitratifractor salsuginis TaxID=269261 RepID=UPI001FE20510|nr:HepT-like ribonuclease domain-containing protein [Nitratifractor salsuginis]
MKNIDKRKPGFLEKVGDEEYWSEIIKLREIISHHNLDINSEIVYEICSEELIPLREKIETLKQLMK